MSDQCWPSVVVHVRCFLGSHRTQEVEQMLAYCWPNVTDTGPTSNQYGSTPRVCWALHRALLCLPWHFLGESVLMVRGVKSSDSAMSREFIVLLCRAKIQYLLT